MYTTSTHTDHFTTNRQVTFPEPHKFRPNFAYLSLLLRARLMLETDSKKNIGNNLDTNF